MLGGQHGSREAKKVSSNEGLFFRIGMKKPPEGTPGGFVFGKGKQVLPVGDPCWA